MPTQQLKMVEGKVGVEIEFCYSSSDIDKIREFANEHGWGFGDDGSVRSEKGYYSAEIRSRPYETSEIDSLMSHFEKLAPLIKETNRTCGFHIHISFKQHINYYKLFSWDFVEKFQNYIKTMFTTEGEKRRLTNQYCRFYPNMKAFLRLTKTFSSRYCAVNFCSYREHKTIEFRIFPGVQKPEDFNKYLNMLTEFISAFLEKKNLNSINHEINIRKRNKDIIITEEIENV